MRVAPLSVVKSSSIHITLATIGYDGHGGGMKLWSACRNIGCPPGPAMFTSMFDKEVEPEEVLHQRHHDRLGRQFDEQFVLAQQAPHSLVGAAVVDVVGAVRHFV